MFKKFLAYLLIISLLLPAIPVRAEGIYKMIGSGAVTQPNMKISAVNGSAFIDLTATTFEGGLPVISGSIAVNSALMDTTTANAFIGGLDVSSYQDGNYKIRLKDSAGKVAEAWISDTAPGGETLSGTELVTNGGFATTAGWTPNGSTIASIAGGEAGNCLEITKVELWANVYRNATYTLPANALYKGTVYIKSGTSGDGDTARMLLHNGGVDWVIATATSTADWVQFSNYITFPNNGPYGAQIQISKYSLVAGTMLFDTFSLQQVTDCAATGGLLLSTKGGSRGFKTLDTGFNPNLALTYEIFSANPLPLHKGYLLKVRDSSKRAIQGYVKAAGTGETLGAEQVTGNNSTFATIGLWNIGGGSTVTGNYDSGDVDHSTTLRIESGDTSYESATFNASFFTGGVPAAGVLLRTDLDYKWISKTQTTTFEYTYGATLSFTAPAGSWNSTIGYYTCKASEGRMDAYVVLNAGAATDELLLDNFLVKQVLTPSATGVTITSTKGGSTFNFAALDSAFNYNDASGYTYELWQVNNAVEVASGSIAANQMLADTTATNAFVAPVGVNLSAYQTGKYIFAAYNTVGGYAAFGFIKGTAPGGETLGSEGVTNGDFTSGDISWNKEAGWTIVDQGAGDYEGVATGTATGALLYQSKSLTAGVLYKTLVTCTNWTVGGFTLWDGQIGSFGEEVVTTKTSTSYFTNIGSGGNWGVRSTSGTYRVDDISRKNVTDCAATGALIVSAKDGATRAWAYKHASFNPNIASTYKVFYVGD